MFLNLSNSLLLEDIKYSIQENFGLNMLVMELGSLF